MPNVNEVAGEVDELVSGVAPPEDDEDEQPWEDYSPDETYASSVGWCNASLGGSASGAAS